MADRRLTALAATALLAVGGAPALAVDGDDPLIVVAGNGVDTGTTGDGGPATSASLRRPRSAAADAAGNVYLVQRTVSVARRVGLDGIINRVAGSYSSAGYGGDGGPALDALLNGPSGVTVDLAGNVLVSDEINGRVRRITPGGTITSLASGLTSPLGIAVDAAGNAYVAEWGGHRVLRVPPTGGFTVIAGTGAPGYNGDGIPATAAQVNAPGGVAVDGAGNVYVADFGRIRRIDAVTGTITTIAGNGTPGPSGDGGPAQAAQVQSSGVAVDRAGNVYLAEGGGHRIRRIGRDGIIRTIAGNGTPGLSPSGGPAREALLNTPFGISVDATGSLLIGDEGSATVRRIVNVMPSAAFTASPPSGPAPLAVSFDGSPSSGVNDELVSYRWSFGDGSTGTGRAVAHTYPAPGAYPVRLTVMDDSGGVDSVVKHVAVAASPPPEAPALTLTSARFVPRWRASRLRGRLLVVGTVARAARLEVRLLPRSRRGKAVRVAAFPVERPGAFTRRVPVSGLLPGSYLVVVRDARRDNPPLPEAQATATLSAPPEGVVAGAAVSTALGGRPRRVVARGPSIIFARFPFVALPAPGRRLTVTWSWSGRPRPIETRRKPRTRRIGAFLKSRGPLPAGAYRAELRAGGVLVAVARVRIR